MKKFLFSFLFLQVVNILHAQTVQWVNEYPITSYYGGQYKDMTLDSAGNVYLTGTKYIYHGPRISNVYMVATDGSVVFSDTSHHTNWNSVSLINNKIHTVGSEMIQRDMSGNIIAQSNIHFDSVNLAWADDARITGGYTYGIVYNYLTKYDPTGYPVWMKDLGSGSLAMKISISGSNIFVLSSFPGYGPKVLKYDTLGNLVWVKPAGCMATSIYADANSDCYVFGSNLVPQGLIIKLDEDGDPIWTASSDSVTFRTGMVYNDTLFACGGIISADGSATDDQRQSVFSKVSALSGSLYSVQKFNFFTSGMCSDESFTHVEANATGIYLAGWFCSEGPRGFLAKLSYPLSTSVENTFEVSSLSVYPNPSNGLLSVHYVLNENKPFQLRIFSPAGKLVYEEKQVKFQGEFKRTVDLSGYAKGIYSVEILAGEKKESRKVVLQ